MNKVASDAVFTALSMAGPTLRKLASDKARLEERNAELEAELNQLKQRARVEKLAQEVHEKHLDEGMSIEETTAALLEKAASGELDLYERAYEVAAQRSLLGTPGDVPAGGGNPLDRAVLGEG